MRPRAASFSAVAFACALISSLPAFAKESAEGLECFTNAQTRRQIVDHRLVEPFLAMQSARGVGQGDAISARLCETGDNFVYEIVLLRRDGHIVRVHVDAANGKAHQVHSERQNPKGE